jgi:hypothetical protein
LQIILDDVEIQENLCFVGGIPIITKFAARQYSNDIRLEAAAFVRQMYQTSTLTLQMFVSAGGLNVLVEFLDEDYDMARDLVLIGVNGIWNVFELQVRPAVSSLQSRLDMLTSFRDRPRRTTFAESSRGTRFSFRSPLFFTESLMKKMS